MKETVSGMCVAWHGASMWLGGRSPVAPQPLQPQPRKQPASRKKTVPSSPYSRGAQVCSGHAAEAWWCVPREARPLQGPGALPREARPTAVRGQKQGSASPECARLSLARKALVPLILFFLSAPCPRLRVLGPSHRLTRLAGASPHFPGGSSIIGLLPRLGWEHLWGVEFSGNPDRSLSLWPGFHWPSMQAFLQATAETSAAPLPLPSSDSMKVISQLGVSLRTLA